VADEQERLPGDQEEVDYVFKAQMVVFRNVQNYWRHGLVLVGGILVVALFYGLYHSNRTKDLKGGAAAIAEIDRKMPQVDQLALFGLAPEDDPNDPERIAQVREGAKRYEEVAQGTREGMAGEAWLKAADAWLRVGETELAAAAYEKAIDAQPNGIIGFGARGGLATIRLESGDAEDAEDAIALYRQSADTLDGFLAQDSLLTLAGIYHADGRAEELASVYDEFRLRFPDSSRVSEFDRYDLATEPLEPVPVEEEAAEPVPVEEEAAEG